MAELEDKTLDHYQLRRLIGRGGMANVYEAWDSTTRRAVAIKVFKREDEEMLRRFLREADLMARLDHPHLVKVLGTGTCQLDSVTQYYIVMPLMVGGTLRMRIRQFPLSLGQTSQCLDEIASALDYLHSQGIVHRDIKASNVLLDREGHCYLTDLGVARIVTDATQLTTTGNVLGTVDYVAPELFEVDRRADTYSDFYSLGVLLYEMVTGRLPFTAENQLALISMHVNKRPPAPRQFVPDLPTNVEQVMMKALAKQPRERYASASDLARAFRQALSEPVQGAGARTGQANSDPAWSTRPDAPTEGVRQPQGPLFLAGTPERPAMSPTDPYARPAAQTKQKKPLVLAVLIALAALVVIGGTLSVYALQNHGGNASQPGSAVGQGTTGVSSPSGNAATASAGATATAHMAATATAVAAPTATARVQATATLGPLTTATAGQPAYQDPLTNANSQAVQQANWLQSDQCFFASDGYHVLSGSYNGCWEQNNTYGDLALSVSLDIVSGHSGGVYFRFSTNVFGLDYHGYLFEVDSQGNYKISYQRGTTITALAGWNPSSALHTGYGVKNLLQMVARNNVFQFYANGQFLTQVTDSANTYSSPGDVGFLASATSDGSSAEIVYSNLQIYTL